MSTQVLPPTQGILWTEYLKPSLAIRHASVCINSYWDERGQYQVHAVVQLVPKYIDPISKDFKGTDFDLVTEEVKTYLQSL